jgi:hypothetical protein
MFGTMAEENTHLNSQGSLVIPKKNPTDGLMLHL